MTIDKDRLKALAEAAPNGPWFGPEYELGTEYVFDCDLGSLLRYDSIDTERDQCLRYVAAANPETVLALLAENQRLFDSVVDSERRNAWLLEYNTNRHVELSVENLAEISRRLELEKELESQKQESEYNRKGIIAAAEFLSKITSSDGSGHADLARSVLRIAGIPDSEATAMVDQWVATRPWGKENS